MIVLIADAAQKGMSGEYKSHAAIVNAYVR